MERSSGSEHLVAFTMTVSGRLKTAPQAHSFPSSAVRPFKQARLQSHRLSSPLAALCNSPGPPYTLTASAHAFPQAPGLLRVCFHMSPCLHVHFLFSLDPALNFNLCSLRQRSRGRDSKAHVAMTARPLAKAQGRGTRGQAVSEGRTHRARRLAISECWPLQDK